MLQHLCKICDVIVSCDRTTDEWRNSRNFKYSQNTAQTKPLTLLVQNIFAFNIFQAFMIWFLICLTFGIKYYNGFLVYSNRDVPFSKEPKSSTFAYLAGD